MLIDGRLIDATKNVFYIDILSPREYEEQFRCQFITNVVLIAETLSICTLFEHHCTCLLKVKDIKKNN